MKMLSSRSARRMPAALPGFSVACIAMLCLATACSVGPDFFRPDAPKVSGYSAEPLAAHTAGSDVEEGAAQNLSSGQDISGEWWTLFHSPVLNSYLAEALKNNPDLQSAQAALRQARETVYAAQGAYYPRIDGSLQASRNRGTSAELAGTGGGSAFGAGSTGTTSTAGTSLNTIPEGFIYSLYDASVTASYNVDIWGGTRRAVESEEAQNEYQLFETEAAYLSLTGNVVTAAVQEASLRAQIASTEEIIKIEGDALRILNSQFELGAVPKSDVLQQQTALAQARATLPPLRKQLAQTRDELMALMGRFPSDDDGKAFTLDSLTLPTDLPVSLPSALVNQRPDIRAAEAQMHAELAQIGVAENNLLPQLTLTASYGVDATSVGSLFGPGSQLWGIAAGLSQPLFHGGTLLHQERASEAAYDQMAAQYRSTVISAFRNVADALRAVETDAEAVRDAGEAARSASDSLKIAQIQFDAGTLTYLTLLTSEQQYQQAVVTLAQQQGTRLADTAALFQALGGGWWNRSDVPNEDEKQYIERREAEAATPVNAAMTNTGAQGPSPADTVIERKGTAP